ALEKYRYEQSLEHTSQFIEKLEKELEEYHEHVARFKKGKEGAT
ncbi:putative CRM domain-containing protein, partial [Trifolium pratense]